METFMTIAEKLGIPFAILVAVGLALWRIIVWSGNNVILPITKKHIEMIDDAKMTSKANTETLGKMAQNSEVTGGAIAKIANQHEEGVKLTREIHAAIIKPSVVVVTQGDQK